jgi:hypothetical protein
MYVVAMPVAMNIMTAESDRIDIRPKPQIP